MLNIQIKGLDKLRSKFNRFNPVLRGELNKAIVKSALEVERKTRPITPFGKSKKGYVGGRLRSSIKTNISNLKAVIAPGVKYAVFVHEGTRKWPLHVRPTASGTVRQFLKEGAKRATPKILFNFKTALSTTIDRA